MLACRMQVWAGQRGVPNPAGARHRRVLACQHGRLCARMCVHVFARTRCVHVVCARARAQAPAGARVWDVQHTHDLRSLLIKSSPPTSQHDAPQGGDPRRAGRADARGGRRPRQRGLPLWGGLGLWGGGARGAGLELWVACARACERFCVGGWERVCVCVFVCVCARLRAAACLRACMCSRACVWDDQHGAYGAF